MGKMIEAENVGYYVVIVVTHNKKVAEAADVVYGMSDGVLEVVRG